MSQVLDAVYRLYAVADLGSLPSTMMAVANDLVPCAHASFDRIETATGKAENCFDRLPSLPYDDFLRRWDTLCHEHPVIHHLEQGGTGNVFEIADFVTDRQFRRLAIYNEIFRECAITHQLSLILPLPGFVLGLALNRDARYTEQERLLLTQLHPHFVQAYQHAQIFSSLGRCEQIDFAPWRRRGLTTRECQVLQWLQEGKRDAEIAVILGCHTRTVQTHVGHILAKFGVETRTAAAAEANRFQRG